MDSTITCTPLRAVFVFIAVLSFTLYAPSLLGLTESADLRLDVHIAVNNFNSSNVKTNNSSLTPASSTMPTATGLRQRCHLANDTIFFIQPEVPFDMLQFQRLALLIDLCFTFAGGVNKIRIAHGGKSTLVKVGDWYDMFKLIFVGQVTT
jgi:hypothetical protein